MVRSGTSEGGATATSTAGRGGTTPMTTGAVRDATTQRARRAPNARLTPPSFLPPDGHRRTPGRDSAAAPRRMCRDNPRTAAPRAVAPTHRLDDDTARREDGVELLGHLLDDRAARAHVVQLLRRAAGDDVADRRANLRVQQRLLPLRADRLVV